MTQRRNRRNIARDGVACPAPQATPSKGSHPCSTMPPFRCSDAPHTLLDVQISPWTLADCSVQREMDILVRRRVARRTGQPPGGTGAADWRSYHLALLWRPVCMRATRQFKPLEPALRAHRALLCYVLRHVREAGRQTPRSLRRHLEPEHRAIGRAKVNVHRSTVSAHRENAAFSQQPQFQRAVFDVRHGNVAVI